MSIIVTVAVPVHNGEKTLQNCIVALKRQNIPSDSYEILVVDDGSTDGTVLSVQNFQVKLISQPHLGAGAARNAAIREAKGLWLAFTDADCIPSRTWLSRLLLAVENKNIRVLGAAGQLIGIGSRTAPARYFDLSDSFNVEKHLSHPVYPYALLGNVMYFRQALLDVGGIDQRYDHYFGPDLHDRLLQTYGGEFYYVPHAVVFHRNPSTWRSFFIQQYRYGVGYAQFMIHHRDQIPWTFSNEFNAWERVFSCGLSALKIGHGDDNLLLRGNFFRLLAQRIGFFLTYWNQTERKKWY
jgi:glycosyltransferase involved in cell wall biosynthesis